MIKEDISRIKVPGPTDKVFKDECLYSFDNPVRAMICTILTLLNHPVNPLINIIKTISFFLTTFLYT